MPSYMPPPASLRPGDIVWDYLRDSGGSSQELSVLQQANEVENFCKQNGFVHVRTNRDVARSGTSTVGRDAFLEMIDALRDPNVRPQAILIWNFSRFARDMADATFFKAQIRRYGVVVHSLTDPITESEYSPILETMIDFANQEKSRQTSRDVIRSVHSMVSQGYSSGGTPPRCYKVEKVQVGCKRDGSPRVVPRWVPDLDLWDLGQLAWKLRAAGKSYHYIQEATEGRIYKSIGSWNSFFANESYLGIGKCGGEKFADHHVAMIDQATWDAVQKRRRSHPKNKPEDGSNHPRRLYAPSLLTGMLFCKECSSAMSHKTYKVSDYRCYVCGKKTRMGWKSCPSKMMHARNAEVIVLHTVLNRILTPDYFNTLLKKVQERFSDNELLARQISDTQVNLKKVEHAIGNLLAVLEIQGTASIALRLKEREAEKATLLAKLGVLENQQAARSVQISPEALQFVLDDWRKQIIEGLQAKDVDGVRNLLRHFIARIDAGHDHVRIAYRYPLDNTLGKPGKIVVDGDWLEVRPSDLTGDQVQVVYEIAPHLAPHAPAPAKPPKPISSRDFEIYRLHTEEERTILSLAREYGLKAKTVWGICTKIRKVMQADEAVL